MAEYIDRVALENSMTIAAVNGKDRDRRIWSKAICLLHDMPTEDVTPVVRCKDCKYWDYGDCYRIELSRPDDFCSYGERKGRF